MHRLKIASLTRGFKFSVASVFAVFVLGLSADAMDEGLQEVDGSEFPAGKQVVGQFVDSFGKPIAGVRLQMASWSNKNDDRKPLSHDDILIESDADGRWGWELDDRVLMFFASKPGYVTIRLNPSADVSRVALRKALTISGIVEDDEHVQVASTEVFWFLKPRRPLLKVTAAADVSDPVYSDANGSFSISAGTEADICLAAVGPNGSAATLPDVSLKDRNLIQLLPSRKISFLISDSESKPIDDAEIELFSWNGNNAIAWKSKTNQAGVATWDTAPQGELAFTIYKTGYSESLLVESIVDDGNFGVTLRPQFETTVTVFDAETKQPVLEFKSRVSSSGRQAFNRFGTQRITTDPPLENGFIHTTNGFFNITSETDIEVLNVSIFAEGYMPVQFRSLAVSDLGKSLPIELKSIESMKNDELTRYEVINPDGSRAQMSYASIYGSVSVVLSMDQESLSEDLVTGQVIASDESGDLWLDTRKGPYQTTLYAWNKNGWYLSSAPNAPTTIQLRPFVSARIRPYADPQRSVDTMTAAVQQIPLDDDEQDVNSSARFRLTRADDDTVVETIYMPVGDVQIQSNGGFSQSDIRIKVKENQNVDIDMNGTSSICGIVAPNLSSGETKTNISVIATLKDDSRSLEMRYTATVDAEHRFHIANVPAGNYTVTIGKKEIAVVTEEDELHDMGLVRSSVK